MKKLIGRIVEAGDYFEAYRKVKNEYPAIESVKLAHLESNRYAVRDYQRKKTRA